MTPEDCESQFARLMTLIRKGKGLLQGDLAKSLNKSRSVVSFFESNLRSLKAEEYPAWADALGVTAEDIEALHLLSYGYRPREGEWTFWLHYEDPEAYDYDVDDPQEVYFGTYDDLVTLINRMAGREICERSGRYGEEFNVLLPRKSEPWEFKIRFPREPFLGDPNNDLPTRIQGTQDDLSALLKECTDEQIALTTAFIRGLHAQARSRLRTRKIAN